MSIYCIQVKSGFEHKYTDRIKMLLSEKQFSVEGNIYLLQKKMKLKNGKEYEDLFFPGYVFFETDFTDFVALKAFLGNDRNNTGFIKILPSNSNIKPLSENDLCIIRTILKFGSTVDIVPVTFDVNDRIEILEGPFKSIKAKIVGVNRRNKRVNVEIEFMNNARVLGLTYEEVAKI